MQIRILALVLYFGLTVTILTPIAFAQSAVTCEQDYTVVGGEWLSTIANRFFGDVLAYPSIFAATNIKSETDPSYATLLRVDSIPQGAKLCIPGKQAAQAFINPTPTPGLEVPVLANATFKSSVVGSGSVTLVNGVFTRPGAASGSETQVLLTGPIAYGALNGIPSVAVVTTSPSADELHTYELHVFQLRESKPTEVATLAVGTGTPLLVLSIANNLVVADVVARGPNDPATGCCATQRALNTYTLGDGTLNLASTKVIGQITQTASPTSAASASPASSPTATPRPSLTNTASPTTAPTGTPSPTATPTITPSPKATSTITASPTNAPTNTPSPTATRTNTPSPTRAPTDTPSPTATATTPPTPIPAPAISTGLRVADVTFNPFGLAKEISGTFVPAKAYSNAEPPAPVGAPAHIAFQFDGADRLWVIPAEALQAEWNAAGNDSITRAITQLRSLLRDKPASPQTPLPFLPPPGATNDLAARVHYLDFDGGSGVAYIGRWAQDPSPVLASETFYSFLGLTGDGKNIVAFQFPVHTSALPDEYSDLTPEHLAEIQADPQTYLRQTTDLLNNLKNGHFGPDLARLDALVLSLKVSSTRNPLPAPTSGQTSSGSGQPTATAPASAGPSADKVRLLANDWKLLELSTPTETMQVPDPGKYTIRFNNAGGFGVTADCNIGAGNYTVTGNALHIKDIQSTQQFCGQDSLDTKYTAALLKAETYSFRGSNLVIELQANGGTLEFSR